jgi:hypothetical protein
MASMDVPLDKATTAPAATAAVAAKPTYIEDKLEYDDVPKS